MLGGTGGRVGEGERDLQEVHIFFIFRLEKQIATNMSFR